ncbi:MAG: hypothetical protein Q9207_004465 [Kuettlingeria erythrocarpa]
MLGLAANIKEAVASNTTCTTSTVARLRSCLFPETSNASSTRSSNGNPSRIAAKRPPRSQGAQPEREIRPRAKKLPEIKIRETPEADHATAANFDHGKLATEVVNLVLKELSKAVKAQSPAREPCKEKGPIHASRPATTTNPLNGRPGTEAPLQPLPVNVVCTEKGQGKKSRRAFRQSRCATDTNPACGFTAQAECARLAFLALKALDGRATSGKKVPVLQLENAMSMLVTKLVALELFEPARRQLYAMRRSLLIANAQTEKAQSLASQDPGKVERLSDLLVFPVTSVKTPLLAVMVNFQLQVLRLIAASRDVSLFRSTIEHLQMSKPYSPQKLLQTQYDAADPETRTKIANQLETLSRLMLSFCPDLSNSEGQKLECLKVMDPLTSLRFQILSLELRYFWWEVTGHQGNVTKGLLLPFSQYLGTFRQRCITGCDDGYGIAKSALASLPLHGLDRERSSSATAEENEALLSIYSEMLLLAEKNDIPGETKAWLQKYVSLPVDGKASSCKKSTSICKTALVYARASSVSSEEEIASAFRQAEQSIQSDLDGGSEELDELLLAVTGIRKAAASIINQSLAPLADPEKPATPQLTRLCYGLCSTCVKFLNRYVGIRPPKCPEHRLTQRYQQRLEKTLAVGTAFADSVISIAKLNRETNPDQWHQTDTGLQACLNLAELTQESHPDTAENGNSASHICVAVSNAYWSRYSHLKQTENDTKETLKALRSSIDAVEARALVFKIAAQLTTKYEHYGKTLEAAREYEKAGQIYMKAIRLHIEMDVLQKAAAAAAAQPVSILFARQREYAPLGRVLLAYSRVAVKTESCNSSKPSVFDDEKLESAQRGVLLEHQLFSLISHLEKCTSVTQAPRAVQYLATTLLEIYVQTIFPVRRCRVIMTLLWLQSRQPASLSSCFLDPFLDYRIDTSSNKLSGLDTGLQQLLPHLHASTDAVLALREDCLTRKQERLNNALATWHSLAARSHDRESLEARVDNLSDWLLHLELLVEYLDACGLGLHRLSTLQLLATVRDKFFPTQHEELVRDLTQFGLQQLRLGYPNQAGLAFHKVQNLIDDAIRAKETVVWFCTAYAEYFLSIGSIAKCEENIARARNMFDSIEVEQCQKNNTNDQSGTCLLVAGVASLGSELAARRGNTSLALILARQSLAVTHHAWARIAKRQRRFEADNTSISSSAGMMDGLVDSMSKVTVSEPSIATDGPVLVPQGPLYWRLVPQYHRALLQISRLYGQAGMFTEAQYYLQRSQKLAESVSAPGLAVRSVGHLADLLGRSGNHKEAEGKFEVARRQFSLLREDQHFIEYQTNLANHLMAEGQILAAEQICVAAEATSRRLLSVDCSREGSLEPLGVLAVQEQLSNFTLGKDHHGRSETKRGATKQTARTALPLTKAIKAGVKSKSDVEPPSLALQPMRRNLARVRTLLAMQQTKLDRARELLAEAAEHHSTSENLVLRALMSSEIHVGRGFEMLNSDPVYCVLHESTVSLPSVTSARRPETVAPPKATLNRTGRKPLKGGAARGDSQKLQPAAQVSQVGPGAEFRQAQAETNKVSQLARKVCATATLHHLSKIMSEISLKLSALNLCVGQEGSTATANGLLGISGLSTDRWHIDSRLTIGPDMARSVSMSRGRLAVQVDQALPTRVGLLAWPDVYAEDTKQLKIADETLDSSTVHEQCLEMIPNNWQVLTVSLSRSKGEIQVCRMRSGQGPFVLSLPLDRHTSRDPDEENFGYSQAKTELQDIIKLADVSTHSVQDTSRKGSRSAWWEGRAALDARLKDLLTNMQNMWFGGFQGMFSQRLPARESLSRFQESLNLVLDNHLPSRQGLGKKPRSQQAILDPRVVELFVALGDPAFFSDMEEPLMDLLYFVVDILQFTGERNAYDEIDFDAMIVEILDALRQYHAAAKKADQRLAFEHTVLILDKELHCFPWESLPCLDGQAMTRLLSLSCLRDRLLRQRQQQLDGGSASSGKHGLWVDRRRGAYVLNAAGDLKATQDKFERPLINMDGGWEGLIEANPSEDQLKDYLHERDIFLYFGHGSGSQYIRSSTIRKLDRCAVALLMGCSSGKLTETGEFEPYGTPASYMQAESPAMVATLWDVTDKDIDRFSETALQKWGLFQTNQPLDGSPVKKSTRARGKSKARQAPAPNSENASLSLDQAVAQGRGACIFRYLNGAAPVVYGIPYNLHGSMAVTTKATIASFGGKLLKCSHNASATSCEMGFNLYMPPQAILNSLHKVPLLIYLAGLTCTGDNGAEKGFFQHAASKKGIAVLYPDTSPRGLQIPGENESHDFGTGAGFYVDATKEPWSKGYNMYSYITSELPTTVSDAFKQIDPSRVSIFGHSMGGHGALTLFLKNPGKYKSVSAFAPIANPINSDWGRKAFGGYFGEDDKAKWAEHDATELVKSWKGDPLDILIDVGTADNFYEQGQLLPENFEKAAEGKGKVNIRWQDGYDHSYFTMATFADDHVNHAARYLLG